MIAKRSGSSIFMVLAVLGVFFTMVMGLLRHSSGEMRQVKQQIGHQSAEIIALSGIDYTESRLRKNRWYQKPFSKDGSKGRPTFHVESLTPPGGEGKLTIACHDVARKTPASNVWGMQQLWLLHHVDVFSLGEYAGKKSLVYGRFIISPEPALNSDSTEGLIYSDAGNNPYKVNMRVPQPKAGDPNASFVLSAYKVFIGQKVDLNTVVAELDAADGSLKGIPVFASSHGKVAALGLKKGDSCKAGDVLLAIEKTPASGSAGSLKTLKKMVRITRIDLGLFPDFDINDMSDRLAVSEYVSQSSNAYLMNFVAHQNLEKAADKLKSGDMPDKMSDKDLLALFPPDITNMSRERAENIFITYLLQNFVPPGASWEKKDLANKQSFLQLDHVKTTPPQEMVDFLSKNGIKWTLDSKPRLDERYYSPKLYKGEFLKLLSPKFNLPVSQFIEQLSWLPDATRSFDVEVKEEGFGQPSTVKEDDNGISIIKEDGDPYAIKVEVQKIRKAYSYVDPVNDFAMQMQDLVEFFKKYYSSSDSDTPKEPKRYLSNIDWPLPDEPGPPPSPPDGYQSVWIPGTPGVPPGPPTWDYKGGKEIQLKYPTASNRNFEPSGGSPDAGEKTYPISKTDTDSKGDSDFTEGKDVSKPQAPFSTAHPPITYEHGGSWDGAPGTDGIPPTQGKWDFVKIPDPPTSDSGSTDHECKSCCFAAGTPVTLADGNIRNIEDIQIGDKVKSFDEAKGKFVEGLVTKLECPVRDHLTTITFENGSILQLTNEHPLLSRQGWASIDPEATLEDHGMKVKTLRVGSQVRHFEKEWLKIKSIYTETTEIQVFNLARVEPAQTYLAGQFVAHNKPDSEFNNENPGGESGGGEGANTGTGNPGQDGTDAGGNNQAGTGPGSGGGGNDGNTGTMPGGGSGSGSGSGNNNNSNSSGSNPSGAGNPGGSSGSSGNTSGNSGPGGNTGSSGSSGGSPGSSGSGYPSGGGSPSSGGGSHSSYSSSSSFSI
ncbi:MAG: hypothetical protein ACOYXC_14845 [Candidatus Rifleibacteriota bacterium]